MRWQHDQDPQVPSGARRRRRGDPARGADPPDHRSQRDHLVRHVRGRAHAGGADRAGRARRPVGGARGRGQHRPRRHDGARHVVRRLG
ncbi:hypothetical protein ACFSTC_50475 [Nonomuraea ferruginea]